MLTNASAPPTLHVAPRVDSATIYKDKSRLRRVAPLSFDEPIKEVQVMVPMPTAERGQRSSFDRDSIQVEFGNAYDGKVILAGVFLDDVDKAALRSDGTVDLEAARKRQRSPDIASASSDAEDEENNAEAAKTSREARREVEAQLADVQHQIQLNEIAVSEAEAAKDYTLEVAKNAIKAEAPSSLATAGVLFDAKMWAAHVEMMESAKRTFARTKRELQHARDALDKQREVLESKLLPGQYGRASDDEPAKTVPVAVLTLKVLAAVPAGPDAVVYVSYMIREGQWNAVYEAHLDTLTNEVTLYYNAEVRMNGGEDLHDVELTLSSAAPRRNATLPPSMSIWRCGVVHAPPPQPRNENMAVQCCAMDMCEADAAPMMLMRSAPAPMMARAAAVVEQVGTGGVVNFAIPNPQTVLANGKPTRVPLTQLQMPATLSYVCVPAKLPAAFTHAKIKNTSDFLLLTGDVAVFLDGNYVTRSFMGTECAGGAMVEMDFGIDRSVEVKRVLLRQSNKKVQNSYLKGTKNNVKTFAYKLTIRNKKRATGKADGKVRVKLIEHIPISNEKELRVRLVSPSKPQEEVYIFDDAADKQEQLQRKARVLENDGVVEIEREVAAGATTELTFSFEVESPSTATVYGL